MCSPFLSGGTLMDFKWITDDIGPEKVVHIYDAKSGLKAIVVIDNTSLGPCNRRRSHGL